MHLANRFKEEDKARVWLDHPYCVLCGSNQGCALHHIKSTESNSILNSIMLCIQCHKYADGHNQSDIYFMAKCVQFTIKLALRVGYKLVGRDIKFYTDNSMLYNYNIDDRSKDKSKSKSNIKV